MLDCPHYTHEQEFEGRTIPEVLLSGDHERIRLWRRSQALQTTISVRPDLLTEKHPPHAAVYPTLHQIIDGTLFFDTTIRWYTAMLGINPQNGERKASFWCGQTVVTFIEGGLAKASQGVVWSFIVDRDQFARAIRYGRQKKECSIGESRRSDDRLSAFFRDPDGRTIEVATFINN